MRSEVGLLPDFKLTEADSTCRRRRCPFRLLYYNGVDRIVKLSYHYQQSVENDGMANKAILGQIIFVPSKIGKTKCSGLII